MSLKETLKQESEELKNFKKVYETVAFFGLLILVFQQIFYLVVNLINSTSNFFSTANFATANLQGFVSRIVNINSGNVIFIILGILAWLAYYVALYFLVWRFAEKREMSKWTWTLFVAFGATIFLAPAFIWFILFAFRYEIFNAYKKVVEDYKKGKEAPKQKELEE
jgi:heme/copper-type cytochrome/quinol oxidase subunit 2